MASHMDAPNDLREEPAEEPADPIDEHLIDALESREDDVARYHLREALQLQIADMQHG